MAEDPVAARWQDYLARLERLTRQPVPPASTLDLRPYPGQRGAAPPACRTCVPGCSTIWRCAIAT